MTPISAAARRLGCAALRLLATLGLAACASSAPTRYFALETMPAADRSTDASGAAGYRGPPIALRAVTIPPAIDRLEMVRETAGGALQLREFDHWAAPLSRLVRHTLTDDLSRRLPAGKIVFAGMPMPLARAELTVDVRSFHLLGGSATLALSWSLRWPAVAAPGETPLAATSLAAAATAASSAPSSGSADPASRGGSFELSVPAGADAGALNAAWSALLGQAADRIVADLARR